MTDAATATAPGTGARGGRSSDAGNATAKALRLLEAAAAPGGPHRLGAIAASAGVPKASAHRILRTLVADAFLVPDGDGGYTTGPRLRALAAQVTADGAGDELVQSELTALRDRTGHTVHAALRSGDGAAYTHKVSGTHAVQMASHVGMRMPLHSTAIGKCVLAELGDDELTALLGRAGLPARTPRTLTDGGALRRELARVRADGFALDDEENETTIRCLGAPLRDAAGAVIGGVSVSTVTFLVPREDLLALAGTVRETAAAISARLR
ncbi:IclR family transcriptional regulator [Streptomyces avicenniae]|uniref:IclR family transcriptional regulator n=1 Tax=Streptomyces avicenniae TaxID=500153 RepID=UPI000699800B|nr:IclR family transcriptional regulator [Streptomyces avicenniae]